MPRTLDYRLDDFKLDVEGRKLDLDIADRAVSAKVELTIEGASTVTVTVEDTEGDLLRSETLTRWAWGSPAAGAEKTWIRSGRAVDAMLDGTPFRLVKVTTEGTLLTLVFEERAVSFLRRHKRARKASRAKVTRAEFVKMLVDEVKAGGGITLYAPELHKRQPIAKAKQKKTAAERRRDGGKGVGKGLGLTVKGKPATTSQLELMQRVLDVADSHKASERAMLAMAVANIGEASYNRRAKNPKSNAFGLFQLLPSTARDFGLDPLDVEACAVQFLVHGYTKGKNGKAGAIPLARQHPDMSPGTIASKVEGSDQGGAFYDKHLDEAQAIVDAYRGGDIGGTGGYYTKQYAFQREKGENSWDAIGRLADEVQWRRFMREGRLWFVSEEDLYAQRHEAVLEQGKNGVDLIDGDLDLFARNGLSELKVYGRADAWDVLPGMVVLVTGKGPFDGKWLVGDVAFDLVDDIGALEATIRKPLPDLPEPASERVQRAGRSSDVSNLDEVSLGRKWAGTQSIFEQFVTPFMKEHGLDPGSQKRDTQNTASGNPSDHWKGSTNAYAIDYPTTHGDKAARELAAAMGWDNWKPNAYGSKTITVDGKKFRVQILWGSKVDHGDHVHVGIRRA